VDSAQRADSDLRLLLVEGGPVPDGDLDRALADAGYGLVAVGSSPAGGRGEAERKLQACRERYRLLFEEGVAGAFQATPGGEVLHANRALVEMLGAEAEEEVVGRRVETIFDPGDWEAVLSRLEEHGVAINEEVRAELPGSGGAWLLLSCSATRAPDRRRPVVTGTVVDITARKRMEADLEWMAYHDPLTGLVNRRGLMDRGARDLALARRRRSRVAVAYLDLAGFKAVNDTHGHEAGDFVLSEVARRLSDETRASDLVARVGGDEFVVLMHPVAGPAAATAAGRRFARTLDAPVEVGSDSVQIRGEVGVALFPEHGDSVQDLLAAADAAMYRLKTNGGDVMLFRGPGELDPEGPQIAVREADGG
jgi:diguanylate cyclase (GGDEF)-like protein/PAS domain S-box-containing protein